MRAIVQDRYGTVDVLRLEDIDTPTVGDDDVLVRVHAAGVDAGVWVLMAGVPLLVRAIGGLRRPRVRVRGRDVAGTVERVGANVTRLRPGDEVFGTADGTYAEFTCAKHDRFATKPARLAFEQAAAVPVSGGTALQAVRDSARVEAGQHVLVTGAGGGVGSFAVQVAKAFGARVTGMCSTPKVELVRSLGADDVIDSTVTDLADVDQRFDAIIDTAGNRRLSVLRRALTPKGTLVIIGGERLGRVFGLGRSVRALLWSPFIGQRLRAPLATERLAHLETLRELIDDGKVTPAIERTWPLAEAADAIEHMHEGRARGKVVVTVSDGSR
jgi:NADPH:quinone reductase-like Zn-dependent oxidoreductase